MKKNILLSLMLAITITASTMLAIESNSSKTPTSQKRILIVIGKAGKQDTISIYQVKKISISEKNLKEPASPRHTVSFLFEIGCKERAPSKQELTTAGELANKIAHDRLEKHIRENHCPGPTSSGFCLGYAPQQLDVTDEEVIL